MGGCPEEFVCGACICCFSAIDLKNILIGCRGEGDCLCLTEKFCIAANESGYEVGFLKEGICKISCFCCQIGLKKPEVLVKAENKCLFIRNGAAFPFADPVNRAVCAVCALRLLPSVGCMKPVGGGLMSR
eukprot:GFYU01005648.1.p1 GENE.GFYU01005648.1~~GFYU01005648.1.p1  ORF type:complete len:150 (+),score=45.50 GFYU01005648.1:62-451(+)